VVVIARYIHTFVKGELMGYHSTMMSRMVCNALEGLADIQVNNLQKAQILLLDQMIGEYL
jgi:hypothetical protein